jgi:hypothetical protein
MDKSHILNEIRRTAEANGGVPLGRARFLEHTGIRETDWAGKYWLKWSDAVAEAGFTPNTMQRAYEDDAILESLALFVREIGHYPVFNELVMKRRLDPSFPSHGTFARLGKKGEIAARLAVWCDEIGGWDDVLALCLPIAEKASPQHDEDETPSAPDGYVYLMKSGRYYKIGRTNSVGRREYELGIQLPEPLSVVHTIATDDPAGIETYWHERFATRRKNGEWFELRREDVTAFRRRKFQ